MDAGYISAIAALAGSTIGGLTSLATSWITQRQQFKTQQLGHYLNKREELYTLFIEEAARLYADAFEHDKAEMSKFVNIYALVSKMRVVSTPTTIATADKVTRTIIKTYLAPNKTFRDVPEVLDNEAMNPLLEFSNACRAELRGALQ
jgi:hypothetical protein